jgi:hypothetical protein
LEPNSRAAPGQSFSQSMNLATSHVRHIVRSSDNSASA